MAKSVNEFIDKLKVLEQELIKEGPRMAAVIANDATALAIARIRREGIDGQSYSTNRMFATKSMFNIKAKFIPTEIASELGRDENGKLVKGGSRNSKGAINRKKVKPRVLWIKFPKAKKAVPVMILEGGYKELRQLNGLPSNFVNLTFTGRMFQNTKVVKPLRKELKFYALVGVTQEEEKKKFYGNNARYGDFMGITDEEKTVLSGVPVDQITAIIKRVFA